MKVQKLGLVLGMNMAVACMMMQGCKAQKAKTDLPPDTTTVVATVPADNGEVATTTSLAPTATAPTATAPGGAPSGVVIEPAPVQPTPVETRPTATAPVAPVPPAPSKVKTVKPLPPPGKPAPAVRKPVVASTPAGGAPTATAAAPAATGFVYTVKPGDQLFAVSRKYNVRMAAIEKANPGLNPNKIRVGQKITIPGVAAPAATVATTAPVQTTTMLASAPAPTATAASTVAPVKTKPAFKAYVGPTKEYKVQPGDSLGKIAYENGITIRALKELNKLTKDGVRAGSTLLIPAEKVVEAKTAEVKKDAAAKPVDAKKTEGAKAAEAKKPEGNAEKKDAAAEVKSDEKKDAAAEAKPVEKKDVAVVEAKPVEKKDAAAPVAAPKANEPAAEKSVAPAVVPAASGNTYTVKEGDDLVSVSITCGISPSQLMDLNGLKAGDSIKPGQVLKLPAGAKPDAGN